MEKHNDTKIHSTSNNNSVNAGQESTVKIDDVEFTKAEVLFHKYFDVVLITIGYIFILIFFPYR